MRTTCRCARDNTLALARCRNAVLIWLAKFFKSSDDAFPSILDASAPSVHLQSAIGTDNETEQQPTIRGHLHSSAAFYTKQGRRPLPSAATYGRKSTIYTCFAYLCFIEFYTMYTGFEKCAGERVAARLCVSAIGVVREQLVVRGTPWYAADACSR